MSGGPRILVIEDDAAIRGGVLDALRTAHFRTAEAGAGKAGLRAALTTEWDLLLLDLVLPEMDGLDILREVRQARPTAPVIIMTARGEEEDRIRGLKLGADDYVVKPFGVRELLARIEAVMRRTPERPRDLRQVRFPLGVADLDLATLRFDDGASCDLSEREIEILAYLARSPGRTVSREELLSRVWRVNPDGLETRTVDMHIARLRDKLRDGGDRGRVIVTVRGRGYRFAAESGEASA